MRTKAALAEIATLAAAMIAAGLVALAAMALIAHLGLDRPRPAAFTTCIPLYDRLPLECINCKE